MCDKQIENSNNNGKKLNNFLTSVPTTSSKNKITTTTSKIPCKFSEGYFDEAPRDFETMKIDYLSVFS